MPMKMIGDIKKFSVPELTSNNNGKTSMTSTSGGYIIAIGGLCFLLGCIDKMWLSHSIDIITQSIVFTGIGATLLGVKNITGSKVEVATAALNTTPEEPKEVSDPSSEAINS
jgi:hypothetical protein